MANWDPSYEGENVNWYSEYIQRHAPASVNWFEQPVLTDGAETTFVEARGLALYRPDNPDQNPAGLETVFAVAPLEDGSVCLWDVTGAKGRKGAIFAKSRPGILYIDGFSANCKRRTKRMESNVTECVSVDSKLHLAFFANESRKVPLPELLSAVHIFEGADWTFADLIEVDLRRLAVVGCESFPWCLTALSATDAAFPLTVGTHNGIHMHDYRTRATSWESESEKLDGADSIEAKELFQRGLKNLFDDTPLSPYAPLAHPAPLSILHVQRPGSAADIADEIYVAGRFPSILIYDRRMFPSIKGSIHSGARLSSLASLPCPFSSLNNELRGDGKLSLEQIDESNNASRGGRTILAFGEYKTKGSLEMYGLKPSSDQPTSIPGSLYDSVFKNRQSSADSKLLSGTLQGTRIVVSDGSGWIKWFERDGVTEVRRQQIGHCGRTKKPSLFGKMPGDDIGRKLLPVQETSTGRVNDNDLLFWTGENLGMVSWTASPAFTVEDFEVELERSAAELEKEREEQTYSDNMRRALERQADDVRFVANLGMGI